MGIYEIAYQNENPKNSEYCVLRFAEVAAGNRKKAEELFYRFHHKSNRIVQIRFKRQEELKNAGNSIR